MECSNCEVFDDFGMIIIVNEFNTVLLIFTHISVHIESFSFFNFHFLSSINVFVFSVSNFILCCNDKDANQKVI